MIIKRYETHETSKGGEIIAAQVYTPSGAAYAVLMSATRGEGFARCVYCDDEAHMRQTYTDLVASLERGDRATTQRGADATHRLCMALAALNDAELNLKLARVYAPERVEEMAAVHAAAEAAHNAASLEWSAAHL